MSEEVLQLNLGQKQAFKIEINPLVPLQILEAFYRKQHLNVKKTVGTLLGVVKTDSIQITNCFAVPLANESNEEDENDEIAFDKEMSYHNSMLYMNKQIYQDEVVIGSFVTNSESLMEDIQLLSVYYSSKYSNFQASHILSAPLVLTIDPSNLDKKFDIRTFMFDVSLESLSGIVGASPIKELTYKVSFQKNQKLNDVAPLVFNNEGEEKDYKLLDVQNVKTLVKEIISSLQAIQARVQNIIENKESGDQKFGQQVSLLLKSATQINDEKFDVQREKQQQDTALLQFISNLVKTQNTIAEKLNIVQIK